MNERGSGHAAYDVLIVGGGINGAAIARDATGRGLSVLLVEQDDLAAHTSSASTKLIHGGLRYLEQYEFHLVGKALAERDVVLRSAPYMVHPLRFVLPHEPHLRPAWMIRAGLMLYDRLGQHGAHMFPRSRRVKLAEHVAGAALKPPFVTGFVYSDAWTDDSRLVVLNAIDAAEGGADILTRTRCVSAQRDGQGWRAQLRDAAGAPRDVAARALVNAAGPWAVRFLDEVAHVPHRRTLRLVKGSHIVVPKRFEHEYAYTFQQEDRRIVFAIPYEGDYTLIGTTDIEFEGAPAEVRVDEAEKTYLCEAVNRYFRRQTAPSDVVFAYAGVRPLLEEEGVPASEVTRDYQLDLDREGAPLLNVFGGKITTHRKLAEDALDLLAPLLGNERPAWTAQGARLPGGDIETIGGDPLGFDAFVHGLARRYPWLPAGQMLRYASAYGTRTERVIGDARSLADLGECYGADLYAAEVDYLMREEWACSADDVLWRRSKLGLRLAPDQRRRLEARFGAVARAAASQGSHR